MKAAGVESYKSGSGGWFWTRGLKMLKTPEDAQRERLNAFDHLDHLREGSEPPKMIHPPEDAQHETLNTFGNLDHLRDGEVEDTPDDEERF